MRANLKHKCVTDTVLQETYGIVEVENHDYSPSYVTKRNYNLIQNFFL